MLSSALAILCLFFVHYDVRERLHCRVVRTILQNDAGRLLVQTRVGPSGDRKPLDQPSSKVAPVLNQENETEKRKERDRLRHPKGQ